MVINLIISQKEGGRELSADKKDDQEDVFITADELAEGLEDLPKISLVTQKSLRSKNVITFVRIGKEVHYKKKWILDYIEINKVSSKQN